ncbi:uncharacterized protein CG13380 [Culicoides brevitarsis]|uniref:uncharacterized protein CG13380 n=1 Tax=Culicoides brevitarsis TaxID=469753 RepID=UPI00307B1B72
MFKKQKVNQEVAKDKADCICYRNVGTVICLVCDQTFKGRVIKPCKIHKNLTFLYDRSSCPTCRADLSNLKEIPIDFKDFMANNNNNN